MKIKDGKIKKTKQLLKKRTTSWLKFIQRMVQVDVGVDSSPKPQKEYEKWKYGAEKIIYEKNVSECKNLRCLIKNVVKRNMPFISQK